MRSEQSGVTIHDPARAADGVTLYTSGDGAHAVLISMTGEVLHEWRLPFSAVWDESAAVKTPQPDSLIYFRKAHLYPNGDLLVIYEAAGDTPWGYGLVKIDKNSRPIWKYLAHAHHDLDVASDGKIYVLTHEIRSNGLPFLAPPRGAAHRRLRRGALARRRGAAEDLGGRCLHRVALRPHGQPGGVVRRGRLLPHQLDRPARPGGGARARCPAPGSRCCCRCASSARSASSTSPTRASTGRCRDPGSASTIPICCRTATCCCSTTMVTTAKAGSRA